MPSKCSFPRVKALLAVSPTYFCSQQEVLSQSVLRRHANDCHNGVIPDYVMNVTGVYHGDAMLSQITESIKIRREGSINNKTEWNSITLPQAAIV